MSVNLRRSMQGILALSVIGLGIALYLSWVYLTQGTPVCNGSAGCSQVQASPYAWIVGVPIPVIGAALYVVLILLSILALTRPERLQFSVLALFGLSLAGVMFSAYLTYLELFVILAICQWCVASAIVMTLIFALAILAYRQFAAEFYE